MEAVSQRGFHAVLYGDRGVGKTSLANVLPPILNEHGANVIFVRTNCDATDSFSTLWRKVLQEITVVEVQSGIGFTAEAHMSHKRLVDNLPNDLRPDDVRRALSAIGQSVTLVVAIDEFDRITDPSVAQLVSDTIKAMSDTATPATILLIGVADSVDRLIAEHRSIERALVQVQMPRMSSAETDQIVTKGIARLGMQVTEKAVREVSRLSQGLPYVTHMLALYSTRAGLEASTLTIDEQHVTSGITKSLDQWQQSIITSYYDATHSHQPDHLYREVLLACALAEVDEKSFFTAAAVRTPLRIIARPDLDIPNFARHLKEFSQERRGNILVREGETRRIRYRFVNPLMRPYIIMRGVNDGLLTPTHRKQLKTMF